MTFPEALSRGRGDGEDADGEGGARPVAGPVLVTGGAGFIGANVADRLLCDGETVRILDNLSRRGVKDNLRWLQKRHPSGLEHLEGDIRDAAIVAAAVADCSFVFHFAAQVAVTTSLQQPMEDHSINVTGTLNILEAMRRLRRRPSLLFASTNKVYGALTAIGVKRGKRRCAPEDEDVRRSGIDERHPLAFISPYGCSKGAADQYVLDYCRSFGLSATVLRMSCIYGPHQQATSDQGWVAHFLQTALAGDRLTIYGDGRQVRDILFIDDFVDALLAARSHERRLSGRAFNIGGGPANSLSLLEMIDMTEKLDGRFMNIHFSDPRRGDQPWFCADHGQFTETTGWRPRTMPEEGVAKLWAWLRDSPGTPTVRDLRHEESQA
ncbi:MAG: NAD-dependent epimerase/dehydratase family protein [Woeseia sp.]